MRDQRKKNIIIYIAIAAVAAVLISQSIRNGDETETGQTVKPPVAEEQTPKVQTVTIDGYDPDSQTTINTINIWKNYEDRMAGIAAKVQHGDKVEMIERKGDGVRVRTANGTTGWLTYSFIKELK